MIILGAIAALGFSVYLKFNNPQGFFNVATEFPEPPGDIEGMMSLFQSQTGNNAAPNKHFSTSDGSLSLDYPSSFEDGRSVISEGSGLDLGAADSLLLVYRVTVPDMMPSTIVVSGYNASSTEEVLTQVKQSFAKQLCQVNIEKIDNSGTNDTPYESFDATYKCGDQGDMSLWHAKVAVIPANDIFYVVAAATIEKNWKASQLEFASIFNSISITSPAENDSEQNDRAGNNIQNNETSK